MTPGLRWRVMVLQIVVAAVLAFCAGFLFWAANFTHTYVHDELVAQKITFAPAAVVSTTEYSPSAQANLKQYAGQPLDNGDKAKVYANDFINTHLHAMGMTYSQASAIALKQPNNAKIQALTLTLFKGETLRGLLLNAWGWWTVGSYAFYAAIGMVIATLAVLASFLFELMGVRQEGARKLERIA